jgi:hypothetical protein
MNAEVALQDRGKHHHPEPGFGVLVFARVSSEQVSEPIGFFVDVPGPLIKGGLTAVHVDRFGARQAGNTGQIGNSDIQFRQLVFRPARVGLPGDWHLPSPT